MSVASYFDDFTAKLNNQNADEIDSTDDSLSVELDSQANQRMTALEQKAASPEQMKCRVNVTTQNGSLGIH